MVLNCSLACRMHSWKVSTHFFLQSVLAVSVPLDLIRAVSACFSGLIVCNWCFREPLRLQGMSGFGHLVGLIDSRVQCGDGAACQQELSLLKDSSRAAEMVCGETQGLPWWLGPRDWTIRLGGQTLTYVSYQRQSKDNQ